METIPLPTRLTILATTVLLLTSCAGTTTASRAHAPKPHPAALASTTSERPFDLNAGVWDTPPPYVGFSE